MGKKSYRSRGLKAEGSAAAPPKTHAAEEEALGRLASLDEVTKKTLGNSLTGTPEEQHLALVHKATLEELERSKTRAAVLEARNKRITDENRYLLDKLASETTAKDKLQELCRQLQKQNKKIEQDEQARRADVTAKIEGISVHLEEQAEARKKSLEDNESLRARLSDLLGKFDEQQKYFDAAVKAKDLEGQLAEAKRQQLAAILEQERADAAAAQHQALTTEAELRKQLVVHGERFEVLNKAIEDRNGIFDQYKEMIEKSTKSQIRLERENSSLRARAEAGEARVGKLERGPVKELKEARAAKVKLEKLCRALQAERAKDAAKLEALTDTPELLVPPPLDPQPAGEPAGGGDGQEGGCASCASCAEPEPPQPPGGEAGAVP